MLSRTSNAFTNCRASTSAGDLSIRSPPYEGGSRISSQRRVSVKINWRDRGWRITLYPSKGYRIRRTPMSRGISKEQLRQALSGDFERLLDEVVEAVNKAKPGHIIDDSEEPVRDAAGEFRRVLFERALELRSQREAFSPCGGPQQPGR
jgi:hypothetical protein